MADKRESARVKGANKKKVLDEATRKLRVQKAILALEQDNYHEDPHADLAVNKHAPKFDDTMEKGKRKKMKSEPFKQRCRKNFTALLEDEAQHFNRSTINYVTARVPPSKFPGRHFCAVCGFPSNYTCVQCGARYCSIKCNGIHKDTRCLKFTA